MLAAVRCRRMGADRVVRRVAGMLAADRYRWMGARWYPSFQLRVLRHRWVVRVGRRVVMRRAAVRVLGQWRAPVQRVVKRRQVRVLQVVLLARVRSRVPARAEARVVLPVRAVLVRPRPRPGRSHQLQVPERASATRTERCAAIAA
jgi:hypothetical protein